jgi:hypothetical protein
MARGLYISDVATAAMADTRCKYASKPCSNERSIKDDGSLHRLCTMHREKAKHAQRRWHARRRNSARQHRKAEDDDSRDVSSRRKRRRIEPLDPADCDSPNSRSESQLDVEVVRMDSPASVGYDFRSIAATFMPLDAIDLKGSTAHAEDHMCLQLDDFFEGLIDWYPPQAYIF